MLKAITAARSLKLVRLKFENDLSTFVLDMGRAEGFNAQRERVSHFGAYFLLMSMLPRFALQRTPDIG